MLNFLKDHPFAVKAFFESTLVLTYALPVAEIQPHLPSFLQADTFDNKWAFVAMAIVKTRGLRPKGFPELMGNDFILVGYRIFVRYTDARGRRLRGLYILRSETNKRKMALLGNVFTRYNYQFTDIAYHDDGQCIKITSAASQLDIEVQRTSGPVPLPDGSPFTTRAEARRFTGPLPFTFTGIPAEKKVLIIEGQREAWEPQPVVVIKREVGFINSFPAKGIVLANACIIESVPYNWKKGRTEPWPQQ